MLEIYFARQNHDM